MTEQSPTEERPLIADRAGSTVPLGGGAGVHPEVFTWLNEAKRLSTKRSSGSNPTRCSRHSRHSLPCHLSTECWWADAPRCLTQQRSMTCRTLRTGSTYEHLRCEHARGRSTIKSGGRLQAPATVSGNASSLGWPVAASCPAVAHHNESCHTRSVPSRAGTVRPAAGTTP